MSKGSPIVALRVPALFKAMMEKAIDDANRTRRKAPYTLSSWILCAIDDKLKHLERSKKTRRKSKCVKPAQIADELSAKSEWVPYMAVADLNSLNDFPSPFVYPN